MPSRRARLHARRRISAARFTVNNAGHQPPPRRLTIIAAKLLRRYRRDTHFILLLGAREL